jgi:hypothetical protein
MRRSRPAPRIGGNSHALCARTDFYAMQIAANGSIVESCKKNAGVET